MVTTYSTYYATTFVKIVNFLEEKLPDCPNEFIEAMAQDIERW